MCIYVDMATISKVIIIETLGDISITPIIQRKKEENREKKVKGFVHSHKQNLKDLRFKPRFI